MGTVIDDRGRITLPQDLREALGLHPGQEVRIERTEGGLVVRRATSVEEFIELLEGCIDEPGSDRTDPLKAKEIWGAFHDHD